MIIALGLVVILAVCGVALVYISFLDKKQDTERVELASLRSKNRELQATVDRIEVTAREHYDLSPVFADGVLDDIKTLRPKELGQ